MKKLLVVTPTFHGYGRSIADAFRRLGYDVRVDEYDRVESAPLKAWNKLRYELPAIVQAGDRVQSTARTTRASMRVLRDFRPDIVVVVRGDGFTHDYWEAAHRVAGSVVLWLYDEIRRTPRLDLDDIAPMVRLASYSRLDAQRLTAEGIRTQYVPTGFDDRRSAAAASNAAGLVSFIGAVQPGRLRALRTLTDAGVPVCAWGREWSDHPMDRARTWRLRSQGLRSGRDVSSEQSLAIMRDSAASLNIHGDQDGFTMRTFEIPGCGGLQLVDRDDVKEFLEPGEEVLVFDGEDELVEIAKRVCAEPSTFAPVRERGQRRVMADHTFVHRARTLEELWRG